MKKFNLNRIIKYACFLVVLLVNMTLLNSCNVLSSDNTVSLSSSFPLNPGNTWTYLVSDSTISPPKQDTIRVSILKTDTTSRKIQSLWTLQFHQLVDSTVTLSNGVHIVYPSVVLRVLRTDSLTVRFSTNTLHFSFPQSYTVTNVAFPLKVGKKWRDDTSSYAVISKDTVSWDGGEFKESYRIVQKVSTSKENGTVTYWIEPDIGIEKAEYNESISTSPSGPVYLNNFRWTLLSYKIY